jgi:DNA-binding transcriptional regulator YhcF (GntR family)
MKKEIRPLLIKIDAKSAMPVYEQVKHNIKLAILSGYLEEGDQLLPIREMAAMLSINPNTILKVYNQLETEGFAFSHHGSGYFVHIGQASRLKGKKELFAQETEAYIKNVLSLGYTPQEILDYLQQQLSRSTEGVSKKGEKT